MNSEEGETIEGIPVKIEAKRGEYVALVRWWDKCSRGPFRLTSADLGPQALNVTSIRVAMTEQLSAASNAPMPIEMLRGGYGPIVEDPARMGMEIRICGEWNGDDGAFEGQAAGLTAPETDGEPAPWLVDLLEEDGVIPYRDECTADTDTDTDISELATETRRASLTAPHSLSIQILDREGQFHARIECGAQCPSPFRLVGVQFPEGERIVTSLCVDDVEQLTGPLDARELWDEPLPTHFPPGRRVITLDGTSDRDGWHRAKVTGLVVPETARADTDLVRRFQRAAEGMDAWRAGGPPDVGSMIEDPPRLLGMERPIQRREEVRVPITVVTRGRCFTVRIQCGEDGCPDPFRLVSLDLGRGPLEVTSLRVHHDEQLLDGGIVTAEFLRDASPGDLRFPTVSAAQVIEIAGTSTADDGYHSGEAHGETLVDWD